MKFTEKEIKEAKKSVTLKDGVLSGNPKMVDMINEALNQYTDVKLGNAYHVKVVPIENLPEALPHTDFIGYSTDDKVFFHARFSFEDCKYFSYAASEREGLRWTQDAGFGTHVLKFNDSFKPPIFEDKL